jgi:hypothetical protein
MRRLAVVALMTIAGCGVGPSGEGESAVSSAPYPGFGGGGTCPYGGSFFDASYQVYSSSSNPWGSHTGVIVIYGSDDNWTAIGTDDPYTQAFWYMLNATNADVNQFESYPQSRRDCSGGQGNPGAGSSPKGGPPPCLRPGICLPSSIAGDVGNAYSYGPYGLTNSFMCRQWGGGGCVPLGCSSFSPRCGGHADGCGGSIYCGACPPPHGSCPCGGVYPNRCLLCQ